MAGPSMGNDKISFILKKGILEKGLPLAFLLATLVACQVPGYLWRLQAFNGDTFLRALAVFVPVFTAAGAVWGLFVYTYRKKK